MRHDEGTRASERAKPRAPPGWGGGRRPAALVWLPGVLILFAASESRADEGEIQASAYPSFTFLTRHDRTNMAFGGGVRALYGLTDNIAAELDLSCEHFGRLTDKSFIKSWAYGLRRGWMRYRTLRCQAVPSVMIQNGSKVVGSIAFGAGFRQEKRYHRRFMTPRGQLLQRLNNDTRNQVAARLRLAAEYRFMDLTSIGVFGLASGTVAGGDVEMDLTTGLLMSVYTYP